MPGVGTGQQGGVDDLFQVAAGDGRVAVPLVYHFALFGDADTAVYRAGWLCQNRTVGRATAARNRAAAPVEEHYLYIMGFARLGQCFLRLVQFPVGGHVARVLVAVGVADHDRLFVVDFDEMGGVGRMVEEFAHYSGGIAQIFARFKEGHKGQSFRFVAVEADAEPFCQQQGGQNVFGAVCHADDVLADDLRAVKIHATFENLEEL